MKTIQLGRGGPRCSALAFGCWRIAGTWNAAEVTPELEAAGRRAIHTAVDAGFTLFDNADIYAGGVAEKILGDALRESPGLRDRVLLATKAGVRRAGEPHPQSPVRYDASAEHLERACEASLRRLRVETIDLFMIHREDVLSDPAEIAGAFDRLHRAGKVRWFGLSNYRPALVAAIQQACRLPLVAHQVEISLARLAPFTDGTLDQCLAEGLTPLAWSPLAGGLLGEGAKRLLPGQTGYNVEAVRPVLAEIAAQRGVSATAVALAWLMRHPSGIVPIVGSTNPERIRDAARAADFTLDREEWYRLYVAARGTPLP